MLLFKNIYVRGIEENDGGGEFTYDILSTFVNATMYLQHKNLKIKILI
jgi:hypothetical protein